MEQLNGGLKDIFSTILGETGKKKKASVATPRIVVHGNGNVIAPGGTVHYVHTTPGRLRGDPQPEEA
jgi:hypothetical protein